MPKMAKECIETRKQIRKFFRSTEQKTRDSIQKEFFPHILNKQDEIGLVKCRDCYKYYSDMFDEERLAESWARGMGSML